MIDDMNARCTLLTPYLDKVLLLFIIIINLLFAFRYYNYYIGVEMGCLSLN